MLAGAICDTTDCTGLVFFLLALVAAAAVVAVTVAVAWACVISAVLRRRGWNARPRRAAAAATVFVGSRILYEFAVLVPDVRVLLLWAVVALPVPLLIWQRRMRRADQSSPCSTA